MTETSPPPSPPPEGALPDDLGGTVRFLKVLTGLLAGTMILGLIAIVVLLVIRWPAALPGPSLPAGVTLPSGVTAEAVTIGRGWALVVTGEDEIVVFDPADGTVRQRVPLSP